MKPIYRVVYTAIGRHPLDSDAPMQKECATPEEASEFVGELKKSVFVANKSEIKILTITKIFYPLKLENLEAKLSVLKEQLKTEKDQQKEAPSIITDLKAHIDITQKLVEDEMVSAEKFFEQKQ